MSKEGIVIVGAGGFARELAWLISEINSANDSFDFRGFVVSDLSKVGPHDSENRLLGDYSWLHEHRSDFHCLAIGIGVPATRLKVAEELSRLHPDVEWPALIHPTVRFDRPSCEVGAGSIICAGVIGTVNLHVEPFCMINLSCTLGHEAVVGRGSVLNPTVSISGGVTIGSGVLIGTGAQVLQYVRIGDGATVGAGSLVRKNVDAGTTVVGVPAKSLGKDA